MLTAKHIATWAELAASGLRRHRDEINQLNVFPIPDSDTGSNMTSTMEAAVERMNQEHGELGTSGDQRAMSYGEGGEASVADLAASLAAGAVVGARGNSGLVLSQLLRAVADTAARTSSGNLPVAEVPRMLHRAEKLVRRAVSDPVEGTIITVLHAAAERAEAVSTSQNNPPIVEVITASRDAAIEALHHTTAQLPALAEAGVVDAGGRGLVVILDALVEALDGEASDATSGDAAAGAGGAAGAETNAAAATAADTPAAAAADTAASCGSGATSATVPADTAAEIEVMFTYGGDIDTLRGELDRGGNSVVVVPVDDGHWRVHVHTLVGGPLIEYAFAHGEVSELRLEALPLRTGPVVDPAGELRRPVLALVPEGRLRDVFTEAGATVGTTGKVVAELKERAGEDCIVLTNGQDTTELFDILSDSGTEAMVVDTESFVGGLAAMAVYSADADAEENAEEMADAVSYQRWATVDGGPEELYNQVRELLIPGGELVTVLYGDKADGQEWSTEEVIAVEDALRQDLAADGTEIEIHGYRAPGLGLSAQVGVE